MLDVYSRGNEDSLGRPIPGQAGNNKVTAVYEVSAAGTCSNLPNTNACSSQSASQRLKDEHEVSWIVLAHHIHDDSVLLVSMSSFTLTFFHFGNICRLVFRGLYLRGKITDKHEQAFNYKILIVGLHSNIYSVNG